MNKSYTETYEVLRTILGVSGRPEGTLARGVAPYSLLNTFWGNIAGVYLKNLTEKSSKIVHPGFRFIHRVLAMCFYGHGEPTNLNREELTDLWCLSPEGEGSPDWVDIFVRACISRSEKNKGKIAVGGMITLIALHYGIELVEDDRVNGNFSLDIPALTKTLTLKHAPDGAFCLTRGPKRVPWLRLPRPVGSEVRSGPTNQALYMARDPRALLSFPEDDSDDEDDSDEEGNEAEVEAMDTDAPIATPRGAITDVSQLYGYLVARHEVEDKRHEGYSKALSDLQERMTNIELHLKILRGSPHDTGGPSGSH